MNLNDEEYAALLDALAREYIILPVQDKSLDLMPLDQAFDKLLRATNDCKNLRMFDKESINAFLDTVKRVDNSGLADALDYADGLVVRELRRSFIPDVDLKFLKAAGFDPEPTLVLLINSARHSPPCKKTLEIWKDGEKKIKYSVDKDNKTKFDEFTQDNISPSKREKRKWFSGLGKVFGAAAVVTGNFVAAAGSSGTSIGPLLAAKGSTELLACAAASIPLLGMGLQDLTGEK